MTRFFSFLMFINGLSPIVAPVVGGQILRFTDWRTIFMTLFVLGGFLSCGTLTMYGLSPQAFSYIFGITGISLLVTIIVVSRLTGTIPDWKILRFSLYQAMLGSIALFHTK